MISLLFVYRYLGSFFTVGYRAEKLHEIIELLKHTINHIWLHCYLIVTSQERFSGPLYFHSYEDEDSTKVETLQIRYFAFLKSELENRANPLDMSGRVKIPSKRLLSPKRNCWFST